MTTPKRPCALRTLAKCALLGGVLAAVAAASAATVTPGPVTPHPVPLDFRSDRYGVTVNGKPVQVFLAAMNIHFASFDLTGAADVRVTINKQDYHRRDGRKYPEPEEFWQGVAEVRPRAKGIQAKTDGRVVTFSLTQAGQYTVERPGTGGYEDEVLFLFANPPESAVPSATDPGVVWIGPGLHQRSVNLTSGQTLYLAPGAVLFGSVNIRDAHDVRIRGRGVVVYSGPNSHNLNTNYKPDDNWHPLLTYAVKGLAVEGVTFVNRSRTMTICQWHTEDAAYDKIKVIAALPENLQADGFDWFGGGHATIRDSLIRSADDCFAIFGADRAGALVSYARHQPGFVREDPQLTGVVSDITIERCVLWTTSANIFRAGWNAVASRDVTLRDCDVIHFNAGFTTPEWLKLTHALFRATSGRGGGPRRHRDYTFENLRFEDGLALLSAVSQEQPVELANFRFKDIVFDRGICPGILRGGADKVVFENLRVAGRPATSAVDLQLTLDGEIKNLRFLPFKE